ncbi:MAG: hypothetical protein IKP42_10945 [Ruminococcus sp.]|nr:hypothetical protein [Ruminococcus sp.]
MTILEEFEEFLGGDIVVGNAAIGFIPNKDIFTLTTRYPDPAVGRFFDLGEFILLRCQLTINECDFKENEHAALFFCNVLNISYKWIKVVLNDEHKLELKAEALIDENEWGDKVLSILEDYVSCANYLYGNCCTKYGKF